MMALRPINWRRSVVLKKGYRYAMSIPRACLAVAGDGKARERHPPVIANSVPKSGTHLLIQILGVLPDVRDWGLFLASTPSFRFREVPPLRIARKISKLAPGELVGAHLFHTPETVRALDDVSAVQYFIYRDPRDVVVSEAFYFADMNRWHRLHGLFKSLPDLPSRIRTAIEGVAKSGGPAAYPDINERYRRYAQWITRPSVCAIRFEDLVGASRDDEILRIVTHYGSRRKSPLDYVALTDSAKLAIDPQRSHTFRSGKPLQWKKHFGPDETRLFKDVAGDLLIELGYEEDLDW